MVIHTGFISFELGHFVMPDADINFVLYPEDNQHAPSMNCKARVADVLDSDLREYLTQGGLCKAVVQGTKYDAGHHEPGWLKNSNEYLRVSLLMKEPEDLEEQIRRRMHEQGHASENEAEEDIITRDDESHDQDDKPKDQ